MPEENISEAEYVAPVSPADEETPSGTSKFMAGLIIVLLVLTALLGAVVVDHLGDDDDDERSAAHTGRTPFTDRIITVPRSDGLEDELFMACAAPVSVHQEDGEIYYNPILLRHEDFDSGTEAKGNRRILELSPREEWVANITDPIIGICELARTNWDYADMLVFVDSYPAAIAAAPLASYTNSPVIYAPEGMSTEQRHAVTDTILDLASPEATGLYVDQAVKVLDNLSGPRLQLEELNDYFLQRLGGDGEECDYILVTNPADATDYNDWPDRENKIPLPSISATAAEVAAHRRALVYFGEGVDAIGIQFGDGYTYMGTERETHNAKAETIKTGVMQGATLLENHGMTPQYVCLVGGPVALPMYYEDAQAYVAERQYTPSDYHYSNIDEDPYMELAPGRIMSINAAESSALVARTLGFDEMKDYDYPSDESSWAYGMVSEDWRENSVAMVGTTKIGPMPGILTPTLANQTRTMAEGGYHVTPMGYDMATQAEIVKEIIDEMNYCVYYGHGDYDCWYSTVPDPVDADMINAQDLKPGFGIAMACLTGLTYSVDYEMTDYISMAFLHTGFNGYVGATRVAYGLYDYDVDDENVMRSTGALYLVDMFSKKICKEDADAGIALRDAKNGVIESHGWDDFEAQITTYEYQLYGDPAGNLHVPEFDG